MRRAIAAWSEPAPVCRSFQTRSSAALGPPCEKGDATEILVLILAGS
jgi:hypothetical protein